MSEAGSAPRGATLSISVNGEARDVAAGSTVAELLAMLAAAGSAGCGAGCDASGGAPGPARCAVEINRQIVPRSQHGERRLVHGDSVEIVTFVGGG